MWLVLFALAHAGDASCTAIAGYRPCGPKEDCDTVLVREQASASSEAMAKSAARLRCERTLALHDPPIDAECLLECTVGPGHVVTPERRADGHFAAHVLGAEERLAKLDPDSPAFQRQLADLRRALAEDDVIPDAMLQAEVDRRDAGTRDFPGHPTPEFLSRWLGVRGAVAGALADRAR